MYLLFAFETYYPSGGWGDFKGKFDTIDQAIEKAKTYKWDELNPQNNTENDEIFNGYWHIVDSNTLEIVKAGKYHFYDKDVEFVIYNDDEIINTKSE